MKNQNMKPKDLFCTDTILSVLFEYFVVRYKSKPIALMQNPHNHIQNMQDEINRQTEPKPTVDFAICNNNLLRPQSQGRNGTGPNPDRIVLSYPKTNNITTISIQPAEIQ